MTPGGGASEDLGPAQETLRDAVVQAGGSENEGSARQKKLLPVTNRLDKEGIFVQIRWRHCNKTNNIQCCQYHALVRILPD